jgi:long-chain fatty acid transport protein
MHFHSSSPARAARGLLLFGTVAAGVLTPLDPAKASGFYLQEQSVRGWGRANSGEVADSGPASLWWNPASIGWDGTSSGAFGATAILPLGRLEDQGTLIDRPGVAPMSVGGIPLQKNPVQKGLLPSNALALRLTDRLALGLAVTSPFSFTTDYDPDGWQRYSAIRTRLITLDVQPSIAFAPTGWLSLGAGVNVEYSDAFLSNAIPNLAPGSPDGRIILDGAGWDLGWSAGVQLRPAPRVTLGVSYKSSVEHDLEGRLTVRGLTGPLAARNVESDTVARFSTPWQLIVGMRAGVTERTTLNLQAVRFGWSKFDRITLSSGGEIPEGYRNTWSFAVGADHAVSDSLTLRAGVQFDQTPTRDSTRDPRVPDSNRVNYNAGASYRMSKRFTVDAAAGFTDLQDEPISRDERFYAGTPAQTDVLTSGRVTNQRVFVAAFGGRLSF